MKRFIAVIGSLVMILSMLLGPAGSFAENADSPAGAAERQEEVWFIEGALTDDAVLTIADAEKVLELAGKERQWPDNIQMEPWREATDTAGNRYFIFQQIWQAGQR